MDIISIIQANLLTPLVLFFILGLVAARVKSDLKIPEEISSNLSIYLLAAIGLHGGIEMRKIGLDHIIIPVAVAVGLSIAMTLNHYQILKRLGKFSIFDSYAIAAAYGSVGATSFSVGLSLLKTQNVQSEGFMAAILAKDPAGILMEVNNCRKTFPNHYIRVTAFSSTRGTESPAMSYIVNRPKKEPGFGVVRQEEDGRNIRYTIHSYATDKPEGERY